MEVDPSTSTDPSASFRAFPQPVVRLERFDFSGAPADNNNVAKGRRKQPSLSGPKMHPKASRPSAAVAPDTSADFGGEEDEDLCLVTRATSQFNKLMDQYNCLMKIHTNKDANFQVELSKLLQDLMVKIVVPSNAADPEKSLNFGRLALILQGSTAIYSKKVEFLAELFSQFLIGLASEIGKAAIGITLGEEDGEEGGGEQSQNDENEEGRPQASKKKKQKSNTAVPFSFVDVKLARNLRMEVVKRIQLRPKIFSVLYYNDQSEKDKSRVIALNPELAGETTCYRMWAPVNEEKGLLNPDCKDSASSKFSNCDNSNANDNVDESHLVSEENLEDLEPPDIPMDCDQNTEEPQDSSFEMLTKPSEQTDILGSKENNAADLEPAAVNSNDPWKTLAPGDTIEDLRLQPQPPVPKFKSRVVVEIEEAYFKNWFKDAKKSRGCFGDENIHEGLLLEKEGKLLEHLDMKNKRKRIDIDSDRMSKRMVKSVEEIFAHHDSDDEDVLGFSEEKPVYQNADGGSNQVTDLNVPDEWDIPDDEPSAALDAAVAMSSDEEDDDMNLDLTLDAQLEDPMCVAARVDSFMKFMKQKFTEDEKKKKFSFKTYCDSILESFPSAEQGSSDVKLPFTQLLRNSEDHGVARQLLASLMLANHQNVEIEGNVEGSLVDTSLSLRLLNRNKHLPSFEEDEQLL